MKHLIKASLIVGLFAADMATAEVFVSYGSDVQSHKSTGLGITHQSRFVKRTFSWNGDATHSYYVRDAAASEAMPSGAITLAKAPALGSDRHCRNMNDGAYLPYDAALGDFDQCVTAYTSGNGGGLTANPQRAQWLTWLNMGPEIRSATTATIKLGLTVSPGNGGLEVYSKKTDGSEGNNYNLPWGAVYDATDGVYYVTLKGNGADDNMSHFTAIGFMGNDGMDAFTGYTVSKIKVTINGVSTVSTL